MTGPALAEVLQRPLRWGWATGLPAAPADARVWLRPLTLGRAVTLTAEAILMLRADYTEAAGRAYLLARHAWVMPDWTADLDVAEAVPLLDAADIGDALYDGGDLSLGGWLWWALCTATGWCEVALPQAACLEAWREWQHRPLVPLTGLLPQDPKAVLTVRPYPEAVLQEAGAQATVELHGRRYHNPLAATRRILAWSLCDEGGEALTEQVDSLPLGCAMACAQAAAGATYGAQRPAVTPWDPPLPLDEGLLRRREWWLAETLGTVPGGQSPAALGRGMLGWLQVQDEIRRDAQAARAKE